MLMLSLFSDEVGYSLFQTKITLTFDVCASFTSLTICANVVSAPTWVASIRSVPVWLIEPLITILPV